MADVFNMTDTWSVGATTYTAIKMNVTDTASASSSLLIDLQVGGSSKFAITKVGNINYANNISCSGAITAISVSSGTNIVALSQGGFAFRSDVPIGWSLGDPGVSVFDTAFYRVSAGIVWMRIFTSNVNSIYIGNQYTNSSNYERAVLDWNGTANTFTFGTQQAGTGTARPVAMVAGGSEIIRLLTAGNVKFTNAANFTANNATATALTAVGPAGANTTVQEWLTIQNAAGTTRYIPCF